jgi:hypothetical protein
LRNTGLALERFFSENRLNPEVEIHSPKINAGLFNVPWEETEKVLETVLHRFMPRSGEATLDWYVWSFE